MMAALKLWTHNSKHLIHPDFGIRELSFLLQVVIFLVLGMSFNLLHSGYFAYKLEDTESSLNLFSGQSHDLRLKHASPGLLSSGLCICENLIVRVIAEPLWPV